MRKFFSNALILVTALAFLPQPLLLAGTEIVQMNRSVIPRFTLEQAILTALQRNADIQRAREEIERTKGLYIAVRAEALPRIGADLADSEHRSSPWLSLVGHGGRPLRCADAIQHFLAGHTGRLRRRARDFEYSFGHLSTRLELLCFSRHNRSGHHDGKAAVLSDSPKPRARRGAGGIGQAAQEPAPGSNESIRGRHGPAFQRPASAGGALESISSADYRPKQLPHLAAPARENVRARFRSGPRRWSAPGGGRRIGLSAAPHAARYGNRSRQRSAAVFETAKSDHALQCRAGAGGALRVFPHPQRQRR